MQQALWQSRQQAQMQGSDPTASSSAAAGRTIEDEIQFELQMGRDFKREADYLEKKMSTGRLTADEVQRLRKVSELWHINKQRVADLCEKQIQENQAQQAQDTSALLGSLQPLQPSRPKTPAQKPAPKPRIAKTMPPPPVVAKQLPGASGNKAPPPVLPSPIPPPVKNPPVQQQSGDQQGSDAGPPPESLPSTKISGGFLPAPTSPKESSAAQSQQPMISPKGRPPARIAIPSQPASQSGAAVATTETPRSVATEDTADLEERLKRKREAKRQQPDAQEGERQDERDQPKHQRRSHHREEEHRSSRDGRRKRRSAREESSSSEEDSDDDHRSTSTRESRSRRHGRSRRHRSRSRRDSRSRRRRRDDSSEEKRRSRSEKRKMNIDHLKKRGGEMALLHRNSMRKTSPRTNLPSNLNHKRSMTNKCLRHHCHHQQLRLRHLVNRHKCQQHKRQ